MKKIRLLFFLFLLSLLPLSASALETPEVTARHALLYDAKYSQVLYERDAHTSTAPASITKVMTALLVCEAIDRGELGEEQLITASSTYQQGLHPNGSTANIQPGEQLTVRDLLYCLLLPSANEAANILAETVSGDVDSFVALMNRRAQELGCQETHFANTHGLDQEGHYTTAYDICLFTQEAMTHELFRTVVGSEKCRIEETNLSPARTYYNTNALLTNWHYTGYTYDKAIGVKTGTTDDAGYCLVSAAQDGDEYLICAVLGAQILTKEDGTRDRRQFTESRALLRWGFQNFQRRVITRSDSPVEQVRVTLSRQADSVMVKPVGEIARTLPVEMDLDAIEADIQLFAESVEAPVEEGQVMGSMTLSYEGTVYGTLDLVAVNSVERSEVLYQKAQVENFLEEHKNQLIAGAVLLPLTLLALRLLLFRRSRRRGRGKRTYTGR